MPADSALYGGNDELSRLKRLHVRLNVSEFESAIKKKEEKGTNEMSKHLLGWDSPSQWFDPAQLATVS
jgi:hypothetical protein